MSSTPEELLKAVNSYENKRGKGRLKIFLGMAPGVGKTYAMLEAAQKKQKEGLDLVVGLVDTHQRIETSKLLEGLKAIPEIPISYKGKTFKEFDLNKVLEMKPQLVILDELAHTNIPGSRNDKRWQDVLELLDANIDVYTTLNVQHVESFKDVIQGIVQTSVWETVPDLILEKASDIELVDLTPQELLERLKEGKVYTGEMPIIAIQNFFQEDRLTALREVSLLLTADIVDKELHEMFTTLQKRKEWKSREKLLILIDSHLPSQQLIRLASRRSFTLHIPWIALYVDTGEKLQAQEKAQLTKNIALARSLGAEIITTKEDPPALAIQRIAEQTEVSEILIGRKTKTLANLLKPSLIDQLINLCSSMDVKISILPLLPAVSNKTPKKLTLSSSFLSYLYAFLFVTISSLLCGYAASQIGYKITDFLFLFILFISGRLFEKGPLLLATLLSISIWVFFFLPPYGTIHIASFEDLSVFLLFLGISLVTGIQMRHTKNRQKLLIKQEQSTQAIYEIVKEIASAPSEEELFTGFKKKVGSILNGTCEISIGHDNLIYNPQFDEKEKAIITWVFKNGKEAGWSTSTLSSSSYLHLPLKGFKGVVGVFSYQPKQNISLSVEELNFLYTVTGQLAGYIERCFAETKEKENVFLGKTEKIYNRILHVISEELKSPLHNIKKAILQLKKGPSPRAIEDIEQQTEQLCRIRDNASAMEKLSTGFIEFQKSPHDVLKLIESCQKKMKPHLKKHKLIIKTAKKLPPITLDFSLMEILLTNLLLNATEYSPEGSSIEIEAECIDQSFILSVSDEGPGIPDEIIHKIFEKFYKAPGDTTAGLGLGLAIVSSIASIHQGEIRVQNRLPHGSKFFLILPL